MNRSVIYFVLFCCLTVVVKGQKINYDFNKSSVTDRIKTDLYILASDSFMGRAAGTKGEILARDYIISRFIESDISPFFGDTSYIQQFEINEEISLGTDNYFGIDKVWYKLYDDFLPIVYSANDSAFAEIQYVGFGITAPDLEYDDYSGRVNLKDKIFVIELSVPGGYNSNSKFLKYSTISNKIVLAVKKGAKGIIFVNSDKKYLYEPVKLVSGFKKYSVPVIYFKGKLDSLFPKADSNRIAYIRTELNRETSGKSYNVAGFINNNAPLSVIIGAHYDHLGYGGSGSRSRRSHEIHNGADDNASGTAAVIELGRYLRYSGSKKYNYILTAFSGEEIGLYGSKNFVKSNDFKPDQINCMINIDMIGRLDPEYKSVEVWAAGSSKQWKSIIKTQPDHSLNFKIIKGSVGNSDHFAFYRKKVPTLFFITGVHADYHKPADKPDKINFEGETEIIVYLEHLINSLELQEKIKYNKVGFFSNIGAIFYTIDEMINIDKK